LLVVGSAASSPLLPADFLIYHARAYRKGEVSPSVLQGRITPVGVIQWGYLVELPDRLG